MEEKVTVSGGSTLLVASHEAGQTSSQLQGESEEAICDYALLALMRLGNEDSLTQNQVSIMYLLLKTKHTLSCLPPTDRQKPSVDLLFCTNLL